jgi:glycine betaine catabolism A
MKTARLHSIDTSASSDSLDNLSLPAWIYSDPEFFEAEKRSIFRQSWQVVCHLSDIPRTGDFHTFEFFGESVVVVRAEDGGVRAFHNVCRHRGARLRSAGSGIVGNLVCPYHQWTYNLRGELISSPHMGESFERCKYSLKPVHLENVAGLLFICLAPEAAPGIDVMRAELGPYIAPHDIPNCKIAFQADLIEHGNWKLTMENNRECNHCSANHPELTVPLLEYGFGYQPSAENADELKAFNELLAREHARWSACGLPSAEIDRLTDITGFRAVRLPIAQSGESQTVDTKVACKKLLGELPSPSLGGLSVWTQPNSWQHFMSDHIVSFSVMPLAPDRTLLRTRWLVHKDAQEGVDYDVERLASVWTATNAQDGALVERAHQGIASPAYEPGPYSPYTEGLVDAFCDWYVKRLDAAVA